jgi:hypothetical protein
VREVATAIGPINAERWHGCCRCGFVGFAADGVVGLTGWLTIRARRMACRAGLHDPFRKAEGLLLELSGWSIAAETLRRHTHAEAAQAAQARSKRVGLPEAFAAESGDAELHIDAGKVNTLAGWRDVKVAVFAARERGSPATSGDYEQRDLPAPSVRSVIAAVEEVGDFEWRCRAEAIRLTWTDPTRLSVLGDGAEWIWNLVARQFAGAVQVLDVYHAVEHLATAGRAAFGDGTVFTDWLNAARRLLVGDGYCGACDALSRPPSDPLAAERLMAVAGSELNYFAGHRDRMGYAVRLLRGQAIGSGLVEGTIKERVNLRLKRTGARWRAERVGPLVELLALCDTVEWVEYWKTLAA